MSGTSIIAQFSMPLSRFLPIYVKSVYKALDKMFGIQDVSFPPHQPFEGKYKLYIIHCFVDVNVSLTGTIMFVRGLGIRSQLLIYKAFYKLEGYGIPHPRGITLLENHPTITYF